MEKSPAQAEMISRHTRHVRWLRYGSRILLLFALVFWVSWGVLCRMEWSIFTASAIRPHPTLPGAVPGPMPGKSMREERDEMHYMVGRGGLFISGNAPHSGSFAQTSSDAMSKALAWESLNDVFPSWYIWRYYWNGPYVIAGIRFLPLAILTTLLFAASIVIRRHQVAPGYCRRCRYDMWEPSNTPPRTMICPECGTRAI
jgi:hypothetical protein